MQQYEKLAQNAPSTVYVTLLLSENYKMVSVNITLIDNLTDKHKFLYIQATFYLCENLATDQKFLFSLVA